MKTENNFAKLFETQDHQVLFQKELTALLRELHLLYKIRLSIMEVM